MQEFVQYHSPKYAEFPEETSEPFSIYTSKRIDDIHGSRVWLIARKPDTSEYYLVYWFIVDNVVYGQPGEPDRVNGANGHWFRPALRIDTAPWFPDLRDHLGNFAFGLRRITDAMLHDVLFNLAEATGICTVDHDAFVDELEECDEPLLEGAMKLIRVNSYERNPVARRRCIEHYGAICSVCDFDFAAKYGAIATGIIHVHHLRPISECGGENYEVDPIAELRPVCPNCHIVLHRRKPPFSIEELRSLRMLCYNESMPPSARSSAAPVPEQFESLVEKLADLSEQDRELVIRAARRRRRSKVELKPVPWEVLWQASGVVSLGGNAIEDTNAIYDG